MHILFCSSVVKNIIRCLFIIRNNGSIYCFRVFTEKEIQEIKQMKLYDIISNATRLNDGQIQRDVFTFQKGI